MTRQQRYYAASRAEFQAISPGPNDRERFDWGSRKLALPRRNRRRIARKAARRIIKGVRP